MNQNQLTKTETKVVHYISQGYGFKEIAGMLYISVHTVSTHVTNVRHKWHARNIADITRMYILSLDNPKTVLNAMVCLLIHLGVTLTDVNSELRRPVRYRIVRVTRNVKSQNSIYYA